MISSVCSLRVSFQQFPFQVSPYSQIIRALHLFDTVPQLPDHRRTFDIPDSFATKHGLTVQDFLTIGLCIFELAGSDVNQPGFFTKRNLHRAGVSYLSDEKIDAFLKMTSSNYDAFRKECDKYDQNEKRLRIYEFNPLRVTPIIETAASGLITPVPRFLLDRISDGIYWDMVGSYGDPFLNSFGYVFERYVGEVLATVYGTPELISEHPYGKGNNLRTCDWIVLEGPSATLIECKSRRLMLGTKVTGQLETLKNDLAKGIIPAVRQLSRLMKDIRHGIAGLEAYQHLEKLVPVIVVLEPFFTGNQQMVRKIVAEELKAEGIDAVHYELMDIGELEDTLPGLRPPGFAELLTEKGSDASNPLQSSAYWPFHSYMDQRAPGLVTAGQTRPFATEAEKFWTAAISAFPEATSNLR